MREDWVGRMEDWEDGGHLSELSIVNSQLSIANAQLVVRRFTEADIDPLSALIAAVEAVDEGISRSLAEIRIGLKSAGVDLAQSGWLGQIDTGQIVGYNYLEIVGSAEAVEVWLRGAVQPEWRGQGLGHELIQRGEADLNKLRAQWGDHRPVFVNAWAYQHDERRCRLLARCGLLPYHIYHEWEIPAGQLKPMPELPPDIVIRPWRDSYCETAVNLRNRAFAHSWGYQPTTTEALRRRFKSARYEPPFSFTAWRVTADSEEMVGLIHACLDWTRRVRQANEGEIVWVAVAEEMRGQGLGEALMLMAMQSLGEAGVEIISACADNYADRPAIGLYTKLGFTVRKAIIDYRKEV